MSYKLVLLFVVVPVFSQTRWTPNKNACPNLIRYPFSLNPLSLIAKSCYNNPNVGAPPNDVVLRAGYPFEQHYVTTEDGYILEIERLPQNKRGAQPVLLMHFLAGSSTVWLDRYNQSLAYALHNEGYDVWAGNVRGTTYSKRHVTLSPNQKEFWDYNLDTIAYYDVSAIVKYIAEETGQGGNIIYGGVSMGCAISYMYLITRPEEANALIRGLVHFSPAAYVYRGRTFRTISYVRNVIPRLIVMRNGYNIETHTVETKDGYVLTLFRIPPKETSGQPVYLQHGILSNAALWVDKANRSLGLKLHDEGYDVWLGNVRGTTYSKKHRNLSTSDPNYWNYNLDTIAENDIPVSLQYIAEVTIKPGSIVYIGHSMGTTLSFMFASGKPAEATRVLRGVISLAPVAYLDGNVFISLLAPYSQILRNLLAQLGIRGLFIDEKLIHPLLVKFCRALPAFCVFFNELTYGLDSGEFPPEDLLLYFASWPIPTSVDQMVQFLQITDSKEFKKFDFGKTGNKLMYGQEYSPKYDLSNITLPVYLFRGLNDLFTPAKNIERLFKELGSKEKMLFDISRDGSIKFNHLGFIYGKDAPELLFPEILDVMRNKLSNKAT